MIQSVLAFTLLAAVQSSTYSAPDGAFALQIPPGYKANRQQIAQGAYVTDITKGEIGENAQISVVNYTTGQAIDQSSVKALNKQTLDLVKSTLEAEMTITKDNRSEVQFNGKSATKSDFGLTDEGGVAWKGWIVAACGKTQAFAILALAKVSDSSGYTLVDTCANTLGFESKTPFSGGGSKASGGSMLNGDKLKNLSAKFKGNLQRESMDKVLVEGQPALTYGSVANFVTFIELIFNMQLTEAEFEATRERFIEYYKMGDANGKKVLAQQGASMLESVTKGSKEEITKNRADSKAIFSNAFQRGAEAGIGYAQVMWDAVQRREEKVAGSKAKPKNDGWDQEVSAADIEATLEMLYFMWVASGRNAGDVTADDVIKVRASIIQDFNSFDAQTQLVICNAQKVYAAIRQAWTSATPQGRVAIARQFSTALDGMGLREGGSFQQSSGGGGSDGSAMAALAQNTAWNAAKTWTTTSSR